MASYLFYTYAVSVQLYIQVTIHELFNALHNEIYSYAIIFQYGYKMSVHNEMH